MNARHHPLSRTSFVHTGRLRILMLLLLALVSLATSQGIPGDTNPFAAKITVYAPYFEGSCFQQITDADQDVATIITDSIFDFHRCGTCYKVTKGTASVTVRVTDWCSTSGCGVSNGEYMTLRQGSFDSIGCFPPCDVTIQLVQCPVRTRFNGNIGLWAPSWVNDWALGVVVINPLVEVTSLRMNLNGQWINMPQQRTTSVEGGPEYINDAVSTMISNTPFYIELTSITGEKIVSPTYQQSVPSFRNQIIQINTQFKSIYAGLTTTPAPTTTAPPTTTAKPTTTAAPTTTPAATTKTPPVTTTTKGTTTTTPSATTTTNGATTTDSQTTTNGHTTTPSSSTTTTVPATTDGTTPTTTDTTTSTTVPGTATNTNSVTSPTSTVPATTNTDTNSISQTQTETNTETPSPTDSTSPNAESDSAAKSMLGEHAMVIMLVVVVILAVVAIGLVYFAFFKSAAAPFVRQSLSELTSSSSSAPPPPVYPMSPYLSATGYSGNPIHEPPAPRYWQ